MRLIDADKLKDTLLKYHYTTEHNQIFRYIDEQPTAYSVDKVVEQIKCMSPANYVSKDDVLKIVKGGGVNE